MPGESAGIPSAYSRPAAADGLPGMPFPGSPSWSPTKDEAADYLEAYARRFELKVRTCIRVDKLSEARRSIRSEL